MKKTTLLLSTLAIVISCDRAQEEGFLGSAVIESKTYLVASQLAGPLLQLFVDEGMQVHLNAPIAVIDTVTLHFTALETAASIEELQATIHARKSEADALSVDISGLEREFARIDALVMKGSATVQQRDNLSTQCSSAKARLSAAHSAIVPLEKKILGLSIRLESIRDQMSRGIIRSPVSGTVETIFRKRGEIAPAGSSIAEINEADTFTADFFVEQPVVATLPVGGRVRIRIDWSDGTRPPSGRYFDATITGIGNDAEFTPKNIQTRKGRNDLVYRIRCSTIDTSGTLKRGMPVELWRPAK